MLARLPTPTRLPLGIMLIAASYLLAGCPQLLHDEFRVVDPQEERAAAGSGGLQSGINRSTAGFGGEGAGEPGNPALDGRTAEGPIGSTNSHGGNSYGNGGAARGGAGGWSSASGGRSAAGGSSPNLSTGDAAVENPADGADREVLDCSNELPLGSALVAGFDDWDGTTDLYRWLFSFDSDDNGRPVSGGFYQYQDGTGDYSLTLVPGVDGSKYAASAVNPEASRWGGGVSLWVHCVDASAFTGLEFWIKGFTPPGTADVALRQDDKDYNYQFDITAEWKRMLVPFTDLKNGGPLASTSATGEQVTGIVFSSQLTYAPVSPGDPDTYVPMPGRIEITVDSVGFYR